MEYHSSRTLRACACRKDEWWVLMLNGDLQLLSCVEVGMCN